jgi:hypothetical protein
MPGAFATFTAISELFVTAAVLYFFWRAWKHDQHRGALLAITLTFEALVNMTYMTLRFVASPPELNATPAMTWLMAGHGSLSLVMFIALVVFAIESHRANRAGRNLVRESPRMAAALVAFWMLAVLSGEALYLLQFVSPRA